jgi:hypothetical protein
MVRTELLQQKPEAGRWIRIGWRRKRRSSRRRRGGRREG